MNAFERVAPRRAGCDVSKFPEFIPVQARCAPECDALPWVSGNANSAWRLARSLRRPAENLPRSRVALFGAPSVCRGPVGGTPAGATETVALLLLELHNLIASAGVGSFNHGEKGKGTRHGHNSEI